ncbi:pyrophosphohydrolase domain-containing protein [Carnobacterium pleistocenium]|uniref:haloacid dehalogenase n=1 Tax=Carnobacterium pleistocenium TaxID=181073 RepID=UPI0005595BE9|nr:haloacid dehalogenase [Carnobacterium pleistocenium]
MTKSSFEQVQEFHEVFGKAIKKRPQALTSEEAVNRANFTTEELVEFLYASVKGDIPKFDALVLEWQKATEEAINRIKVQQKEVHSPLIGQVDALTDANYFNYGSFVLLGIDPEPIFSIVHQANMGKVFADGKPRHRKTDGKVMKPANWETDFAPEPKIRAEIERQINRADEGIV